MGDGSSLLKAERNVWRAEHWIWLACQSAVFDAI